MVAGEKERGEGGERRSSTAGLKTYVTVGSQQTKWERKLGQQQNTHFVILKLSSLNCPFVTGIVIYSLVASVIRVSG